MVGVRVSVLGRLEATFAPFDFFVTGFVSKMVGWNKVRADAVFSLAHYCNCSYLFHSFGSTLCRRSLTSHRDSCW